MGNKEWGGVILNPGCNNYCVFCGQVKKVSDSELRQQEIKVAKNLIDFKREGLKKIEISGSDPIEYNKLIPLIGYIKKIGFEYVQLSTHGTRLSDEIFLNNLISSGLDKLRIPLYGSNARIHDSVTKTKGSFDAVLKGIRMLLEKTTNVEVQISSLIMQQNKDDLVALIKLARELKVADFYFSVPCVANDDYSYCVPFKDLGPYVRKAYDYALEIGYKVTFREIPFCVFGKVDELIENSDSPPSLGKYCQPPEQFVTSTKDLPSYRVKNKVGMCNGCKCFNFCDGFFINDIKKFGTGNLKPLKD